MDAVTIPLTFDKKQAELTESQWVLSESVHRAMSSVVSTQVLMFVVMLFMAMLLYGEANTTALVLWLVVNVFVSSLRLWFLRGYNASSKKNNIEKSKLYFQRYSKLAPFSGFVWATSVYLFNGVVAPNIAVFSLLILVVYGMFSMSNLSSYLPLMNRFIGAYFAGLLFAVFLHIAIFQNFSPDAVQLSYLLIIVIFVYMQFRVGERMNLTYTEGLKLQFRNRQLIDSLTEQRETALAAVATKNRMLASATHDMRQPVLALDLYASWLIEDPSASTDIAPKIAASTKAVIELFDSMFDMSRLTEGQISTHSAPVQLNDLFSELYMQYQPIAASKNLFLRIRPFNGSVFTDHILLERILGNLITNAIRYTEHGGVLLSCRRSGQRVKIQVWDTGVGISEDQQDLVFKEFYKSPSNAGTSDGFGLGLAIVSQLAELIGAELTLRSRRGHGTVVSVQLGQII